MPFTPRDWRDDPDHTTPITAAALEDLETRVAAYADDLPFGGDGSTFVRRDRSYANVKDHGALGDGTTDDTAAIQAAIDSLPTPASQDAAGETRHPGGMIFFPRGRYRCASGLNLDDKVGITLFGEGERSGGYSYRSASTIFFSGTGSGRFLSCRSTGGLAIRDLGVQYTSASYTGNLIDFSQSASLSDSGHMVIERCLLGGDWGTPTNSANCVISLHKAIIATVRDCNISFAQYGIRGGESGAYSNAVTIDNCSFDNTREAALAEAGEDWTIINPTFEGTAGVTNYGMKRAYYQEDTGSILHELTFLGGWAGDNISATYWIETAASSTLALRMYGGTWSSGTATVKLGGPTFLDVHGIGSSSAYAFDLPASWASNNCHGLISGNNFRYCTNNPAINLYSTHQNLEVTNNRVAFGQEFGQTVIAGHVRSYDFATPSVAAGAQAGSGATAGLLANSNDTMGQITVTTGTGPSAGSIAVLTPARTRPTDVAAKLLFTPANDKAGANAPGFFAYLNGANVEIRSNTAPAVSTVYVFNYWIVQ